MRRQLWDGPVKGIVKASEMCRRREDRLRGSDEPQRLRDVQRREMRGRAQLVQELWRDELVRAELGASMHDAMAYSHGREGIRVNCILPGHLFTPMGNQGDATIREARRRAGMLGTEGTAWDVGVSLAATGEVHA